MIAILASRRHPEQGFRTCLGIMRLFRDLDKIRAEAVSLGLVYQRRASAFFAIATE